MTHTKGELQQMQSLPLSAKILMTKRRIKDWYDYWDGQVYVSFSGGKDSTVLLHISREVFSDIEAVFVNTGLEYPEIQDFVKKFDNITILRPKMRFDEVIKSYGYPMIGKEVARCIWYAKKGSKWAINQLDGLDWQGKPNPFKKSMYSKYKSIIETDFDISDKCCLVMKKRAVYDFEKAKKPIMAMLASESKKRETAWLMTGCNAFTGKKPISNPMAFWTEQDVLRYIKERDLPIASVYGEIVPESDPGQVTIDDFGCDSGCKLCTTGAKRTGCIFCGFGAHLEKGETRFQRLKRTHPKQYAYCLGGGAYDEDGLWKPDKNGLGMKHVFDVLNEIYGKDFIRYE